MRPSTPTAEVDNARRLQPPGAAFSPPPSPTVSAEGLTAAILSTIDDSLSTGMYEDAVFYAERLYEGQPTYRNLHTLASCHARSDGGATACRLLQHHYPFFEVHVTRPESAGSAALAPNPTGSSLSPRGTSVGLGRPHHSFSPPNPALLAGRRRANATTSPRTNSPLSARVRSAFRRGDNGEPILLHEPVDLAARWDCQYLYGVCCARSERYSEGTKVLEELLRVCGRLEAEEVANPALAGAHDVEGAGWTWEQERQAALEEANPELAAAYQQLRQQRMKNLGSCTAGCPRYYVQRIGEVQYWLGLCARRQNFDSGPQLQRSAFLANPLLFSAFEGYVRSARQPPRDSYLSVYASPEPYAFAGGNSGTASPAFSSSPSSVREREREREEARGRNALRRFLAPYTKAAFLVHTFRCQEAQRALQPECFPQALLPLPAGTGSACGNSGGDSAATALPRMSAWRLSHYALARFHYGDMRGSAAAFQQLLAAAPWRLNDAALMYYSTALWQLRADGDLGALAQRLTEEMPMSPITLVVVANTYSLAKEPKDAIAMLDRAIQTSFDAAYAHALRGYELLSMGMNKEARDAFNKAINTDNNMYTAYAGLGELSVREEHVDTARQFFKQAIAINPLPTIMNRYAATHHRRGASSENLLAAYTIYSEAIRRNSTNVSARHQRADVLLSLGKVRDAMADVQEMIQSYPDEAMLFVTLARCQEALGMTRQAVLSYHRAMTLDPRREGFIRGCIENLSAAASGDAETSGL